MTYPTDADVKTFLGITGSGEDALVGWLLEAAIQFVESYCGHTFVADELQTVEVVPEYPNLLDGRRVLLIRDTEFMAVTSVKNGDGVTLAASDYKLLPRSGPPYHKIELRPGLVWWRGSDGLGVVEIGGTTGTSTGCPADVFLAIIQIAAYEYRARQTGAGGAVTTATRQGMIIPPQSLAPHIMEKLNPYRRQS